MSVAENIAYGLRRKGWKRNQLHGRVQEMLRLVQLEGLEDRRPSQLSGGQARRVGLARALATSPEVLLLDEPLSALDLTLRKEMELQLRRIHKEIGTTFVYVTHDQEEALVMSQRIVVMRSGRIVQDASPREIYMRPKSVFVAGFIGEINLLNGRVEHLENDRYRVLISGGESVLAFYEDARLREGEDVVLSLRPELVTLGGVPTGDTNSLDGEIEEAIYLGNHMRLRVRTQGGTEIWCHAPVERGVDQLERQVSIGWRITDARLLATDTGKEGPPSKDHQSPPTTGTSAE